MARKLFALLFVGVATIAGCSFSVGDTPESVAEELIEGELADQVGLSDVSADCDAPANEDVGTTFECTSSTEIGDIRWQASIEEDDFVNVTSTNLLDDADLTALETAAVDVIEQQAGRALGYENFTCGVAPIAVAGDSILPCELVDPDNGDIYDAEIEITDFETGGFNVEVAELPRG